MKRIIFVTGLAAGFVLGTRAGRERYETIAKAARAVASRPEVHSTAGMLHAQATHAARIALGRRHASTSHVSPN